MEKNKKYTKKVKEKMLQDYKKIKKILQEHGHEMMFMLDKFLEEHLTSVQEMESWETRHAISPANGLKVTRRFYVNKGLK